ncbi:hypothetical protein MS3_00001128 [Schistosoma haematobium]|uniref:Reverse transcriptase domain-containing protein n=1 Tax=Schistosoma haematobium TaxID=6185 RepID=A0A922LP28_SCHHA|nr:hypothetical protein MS3_00001128 [Schistosoma haematobium]KAH9590639.1 hypothetical protein MS3_00001128 [Schistosoma haematobium]
MDVTPRTIEEARMSTRQINSGKAAGPDDIPAEALKSDLEATANMRHILFRRIWEEEHVPTDWKEGYFIKIPKRGDPSKCENYKGITLMSVPGNPMKDTRLRDQQTRFRKNRLCTDQIVTLWIIVEQSTGWNSSLYTNFLDYEAFDNVDM